jgi:ribonuclease HI
LKEKNIEVILQWVPSHISIEGNEKADKAAKEAAEKSISPGIERYSLFSYITRRIKAQK